MPIKDRTGLIYGCYKALNQDETRAKGGSVRWVCECTNCGTKTTLAVSFFKKDKLSKNCPNCRRRNFKGFKEIPKTYWSRIQKQAKKRNLDFNLTIEEAFELFEKQNKKCFYTNEPINFSKKDNKQTASLDRLNSSFGYHVNNVVWCHKTINRMKGTLSKEDFLKICEKVVNTPKVLEVKT